MTTDEREIRKRGMIATAGLIAADRETVALPARLADTLDLARRLLVNQTSCERSLCEGCESARRTVLEAVEEALEAARKVGL